MKFYKYEEYRSLCLKNYDKHKKVLEMLLPWANIEHVGASSVPGAISKGDLDICAIVEFDKHDLTVRNLISGRYKIKHNTLRTPELCMLESIEDNAVAIQVVVSGSKYDFFVQFRELLIKSEELLEQYNAMKICCSGLDENEYRNVKSIFIENVLRDA